MTDATWTDERVETLTTLWLAGRSCSEIARDLGGTTRSAIIGKVTRLGLQRDASTMVRAGGPTPRSGEQKRVAAPEPRRQPTPPRPPKAVAPRPTVPAPASAPHAAITPAPAGGRILARLGPSMCRWPLDDPGPGNCDRMLFCAAPVEHEKTCYCREHAEMAVVAGANRKTGAAYARSLRRYE